MVNKAFFGVWIGNISTWTDGRLFVYFGLISKVKLGVGRFCSRILGSNYSERKPLYREYRRDPFPQAFTKGVAHSIEILQRFNSGKLPVDNHYTQLLTTHL